MPLPTDPLLNQQWHLGNSTPGLLDLNVRGVWNPTQGPAYTGAGIRAVVIDDGFDYNHSDLAPNYDTTLDFDFTGSWDYDPFGDSGNAHGTAVTGIIGADNNGTGAVGVAFDTSLVGYRTEAFINDNWLGDIRDAIHYAALNAQGDVANISQGIANDEDSEFGAGYNAARFDEIETSIGEAVTQGRGGLGMTIVKSAGNSRADNYDVNADDWSNDTRQVVVAAVDQNGYVSSYSSYGAAILVSGFGTPGQVVTTDRTGAAGYNNTDFTSGFNGTSSAAPMVTGVVSLMYDANYSLGWRDVQSILANSARHVGSSVDGVSLAGSERYAWNWNASNTWNGGGMHFSNDYGYGLVDALAAVRMAETWHIGSTAQTSSNEVGNTIDMLNSSVVIPDGNATGTSFTGNAGFNDEIDRVTVTVSFSTTYLGDVDIYLTSPEGTVSRLINDNAGDANFNGTWTFESQAFRGERAGGNWTVRIVDDAGGDVLQVSDVVVRTYGRNVFDTSDRYVFTNEYSDYDGVAGHSTNVTDTNGGVDTVNAAAVTSNSIIRLDGVASSIDGVSVTLNNMENAIGGDGNDTLIGNASINYLYGGRGNDSLYSFHAGTDTLNGGYGNDTYYSLFAPNIIDASGIDSLFAGYNGTITDSSGIEIVYMLEGQPGFYFAGNSFNNVLYGTSGANTLWGFGGADTIYGGAGSDTIYGDLGTGVAAGDAIYGEDGDDTILGGGGGDWIYGGFGTDTIVGEGGNDLIYGQGSTDYIDGREGNDQIFGDDGNDIVFGDGLASTTGYGSDMISGGAGDDLLAGESTDTSAPGALDVIYGDDGNDTIYGGAGNDFLYGGNGNDVINGGAGTDVIIGGQGADIMLGSGASAFGAASAGGDLFVYSSITDGGDWIYGFDQNLATGRDGIDFSALYDSIGYGGTTPRAQGYLYVFQNGLNTDIYIDANGAAGGVNLTHMITLADVVASTIDDSYFLV